METKNDKKILHLHLQDGMGNKSTLICMLKEGSIRYSFYGGTGSSGTRFSLRNIQFYKISNGNIHWLRDESLPIENEPNETEKEFKQRIIDMLNNSTKKVINVINNTVRFA